MIEALYTHLAANKPTGIETVGKGWDIEALDSVRDIVPAMYISPADDTAEDSGHDFVQGNYITQHLQVDIVCLLDDFETIRGAVRSSLIGWSESTNHDDLALDGGRTLSQKGDLIWWEETYHNRYQKISS